MKISVLSMFRDSEDYLEDTLARLSSLEDAEALVDFEYFFYENDSTDATVTLLEEWLSGRKGLISSEQLNKPKFSQSTAVDRQIDMTAYRNSMLSLAKPLDSDYSIILDSDVEFDSSLVREYLPYFSGEISMVTPNILQNIKCQMSEGARESYYDSFALIDRFGNHGMIWASNPFFNTEDRNKWNRGDAVEVRSAFGGCPMIKSNVLNEIEWSTDGGCEHWNFCRDVSSYGKIIVAPRIKVRVSLSKSVIESISPSHMRSVIERQKQILPLLAELSR
jgi:GT2 family glycosyltransferase